MSKLQRIQIVAILLLITFAGAGMSAGTVELELHEFTQDGKTKLETVILAGGCFWCMDAVFSRIKGVKKVVVGYIGGKTKNPSYQDVCTKSTGHAEAAAITFDPSVVNLTQIMDTFFSAHDPTSLNRQGYDEGTQYRSALFPLSATQEGFFKQYIVKAQAKYPKPIVTSIESNQKFYQAEDYHQQYFEKNPNQGYCAAVIKPKLDHLKLDSKPLVQLIK